MAPKRKSAAKTEEPNAKEPKLAAEGEPAKAADVAVAAPDTSEKEVDAPADKRPPMKEEVTFHAHDTTLNVVPVMGGKILCPLTEGGLQYLVAGARASAGVKAGRYMYEVKIMEALPVSDRAWPHGSGPKPKHLLRVGFSAAGASLALHDEEATMFFDSDGYCSAGKKRTKTSKPFVKDMVIAVLLNLDPKSPNADTVSIFRDGERAGLPQALPDSLKGKTLFPHIGFRNFNVQVNMGPDLLKELPFKCRLVGSAAKADVEVVPAQAPAGGKHSVMVPVAYPDEGTFEWLDGFLAKNPQYVELSDRKILEWATSSGLWKNKQWNGGSADKPDFAFGLPGMEDLSVQKVLSAVAPVVPRNYVVMEVKANLLQAERKKVLSRFSAAKFKRTACVVMGEPDKEFKKGQVERVLQAKQAKSDLQWRVQKNEKAKKKAAEVKAKQLAEVRRKAEEARKKAQEAAKKKKEEEEAAKKAKEEGKSEEKAEEKKEEKKEEKEEDKKEDDAKMDVDEKKEEEKKEDEPMEEEEEESGKIRDVELTDEEKNTWFAPRTAADLKERDVADSFASFTIPSADEGFDEVKFAWAKDSDAKAYLRNKVLEKKKVTRVENLKPSPWFKEKVAEWKKLFGEWQKKLEEFKASPAQKAKAAKKKDDDKEDAAAGDLFAVENVSDVGAGVPLYRDFELADWALLQLRFEMYMVQAAFKKDVNDPDRPGIPEGHFGFYFSKYFSKQLIPKHFGVASMAELTKMVKDTAVWEDGILSCPVTVDASEDLSYLVKLAEEHRRERQRRIDAGDETARLKVTPQALATPAAPKPAAPKPAAPKPAATKPAEATPAAAKPAGAPAVAKPALKPVAPKPAGAPAAAAAAPGVVKPLVVPGAKGGAKGAAAAWQAPSWQQKGGGKAGGKGGYGGKW